MSKFVPISIIVPQSGNEPMPDVLPITDEEYKYMVETTQNFAARARAEKHLQRRGKGQLHIVIIDGAAFNSVDEHLSLQDNGAHNEYRYGLVKSSVVQRYQENHTDSIEIARFLVPNQNIILNIRKSILTPLEKVHKLIKMNDNGIRFNLVGACTVDHLEDVMSIMKL